MSTPLECLHVTQMAYVNLQWSLKHREVRSPWVLPVTLYDPCYVQVPPNFFHEADGIYSSDGFMGPISYPIGPILCSSYDVSKIISGLTTTSTECFHGHTNFPHELASVVGT